MVSFCIVIIYASKFNIFGRFDIIAGVSCQMWDT